MPLPAPVMSAPDATASVAQERLDQRLRERLVRDRVGQRRHPPRVRQIEALVELAPAAQLGAQEVPREAEQPDPALGLRAGGLKVGGDLLAQWAFDVGARWGGHEATASDELEILVRPWQPLGHPAAQGDERP